MKFLFLIADGMGDWPLESLGGKTPLQAASTPNLDAMAATAVLGRCRTVPEGMAPGSDVANMALLGFDPAKHHTGRGPIEAAAQGLALDPDDLVWRCNLVTVTDLGLSGVMRDYSAGHITSEAALPLLLDLQERLGDETFTFHPGVQYRHLLVQKGGALEDEAKLAVRPPHDITDKPIKPDLATFSRSPRLWDLLHGSAERLARKDNATKANSIWPWGQGRPLHLPDFGATFGLSGAVISAVDLVRGLGRAAGMEVIEVPGATGLLDTNYEGKVEAALKFLETGDFVFVHLEGPDECGHAGDAADKTEAIARFDARVVGPLRRALGDDAAWLIACDHYTPIKERTHTPDPVPFLFQAPGVTGQGAAAFDETTADAAGLLLEQGHTLLSWCLERMKG
ncbi:cofactor-independent phosphoglycerate mutase [Desulfovibrio aminophilus]|nr:cofactor-independent phosphoglycerate mutase [Desulfovibrio aminophilus]MCM0756180.1 cofactor-independent phosphoglycerate mutase [Desulfovibrio aminophilus]